VSISSCAFAAETSENQTTELLYLAADFADYADNYGNCFVDKFRKKEEGINGKEPTEERRNEARTKERRERKKERKKEGR